MLRIIIALVIGAHGIGHLLFLVPLFGTATWGQSTRSWLLTDINAARLVGAVIWIVVLLGFGATVYGLLSQQTWWRAAALVAAGVSIVGLLLFWAAPPTSPVISALVFNLVVIGALVIVQWPSVEAVGA